MSPEHPIEPAHHITSSSPQRIDEICQFKKKKNIKLREFIHVYVTTQGPGGYRERSATRAKRLAEAIHSQPEVLDAIRENLASTTAGIITIKALWNEMKVLEKTGGMFCTYKVNCRQEAILQDGITQGERLGDNQ